MVGAIIIAVLLVIVMPVGLLMSGALAAGLLGGLLKADADARYEGSDLIELNR